MVAATLWVRSAASSGSVSAIGRERKATKATQWPAWSTAVGRQRRRTARSPPTRPLDTFSPADSLKSIMPNVRTLAGVIVLLLTAAASQHPGAQAEGDVRAMRPIKRARSQAAVDSSATAGLPAPGRHFRSCLCNRL